MHKNNNRIIPIIATDHHFMTTAIYLYMFQYTDAVITFYMVSAYKRWRSAKLVQIIVD